MAANPRWKKAARSRPTLPGLTGGGAAAERGSVSPESARRRWRAVAGEAMAAACRPDDEPAALKAALRELKGAAFPIAAHDLRAAFARAAEAAIVAFAQATSTVTRREAAALTLEGARWLEGELIAQGAALARASVARIDPGERED